MKANLSVTSTDSKVSASREAARRFRVIAELGEGGMARVHLAMARGPSGVNKLVVLKTLRSHLANDAACLEMFLHEARLAARLNHPNVVQTYEVTEEAGRQVMVMEYLEGQPLSHLFARARKTNQLPIEMYVHALCDTLAGLHYAHELADFDGTKVNLVHRDVSPQNIFVTFDGQVKILDFGIAKAAVNAPSQTETGVLKGKVRYMAPEQIAGDPLDRRADLFAVGAVLWEILADERIWSGVSDLTVMQRVTAGDIPSPRTVNPQVPEILERICLKAMSVNPDNRFATAQEFQIALEDALGQLGRTFKQRDLGNRVAELFADTRAEIRAIIETQMSKAEGMTSTQLDSLPPVPLYGLGMTPTPSRSRTASTTDGQPVVGSRLRSLVLVVGGIALGAGALVWLTGHRPAAATPQVAPPVATVAPPVTAPVQAPVRTRLTVSVAPGAARVFLDNVELPSNPYSGTYPQDGTRHQIRAEAAGYLAQTTEIALDHDTSVSIALERDRPTPRPGHGERPTAARAPAAGPAPSSTASAAPAKPSCAEPYYFDEKGIKKIKPECL
jgi:eukaryotic-like serine/threonine-protein kinase